MIKNPPGNTGVSVQSLDQENPLEKGMTTHSSLLAWRIPWTEEPGGLQSTGSLISDITEQLNTHTRREQREHLKREVGQSNRGNGPRGLGAEFLRQDCLHNPGGH